MLLASADVHLPFLLEFQLALGHLMLGSSYNRRGIVCLVATSTSAMDDSMTGGAKELLQPRSYQIEMLEESMKQNVIIAV